MLPIRRVLGRDFATPDAAMSPLRSSAIFPRIKGDLGLSRSKVAYRYARGLRGGIDYPVRFTVEGGNEGYSITIRVDRLPGSELTVQFAMFAVFFTVAYLEHADFEIYLGILGIGAFLSAFRLVPVFFSAPCVVREFASVYDNTAHH